MGDGLPFSAVVAYELVQRWFVQPLKHIDELRGIAFALGKSIAVFHAKRADQHGSVLLRDLAVLVAIIDRHDATGFSCLLSVPTPV
jgi:hypothetical protein